MKRILFAILGLLCLTVGILDVYWAATYDSTFYAVFAPINIIGGVAWLFSAVTAED
jgi:hypothetical protein